MRKLLYFVVVLIFIGSEKTINAQAYSGGKFTLTLGYGAPNLFNTALKNAILKYNWPYGSTQSPYSYTVKGSGPFLLKCDYGLSKVLSMGVSLGYSSSTLTETYKYRFPVYNGTSTYDYYDYTDITTYKYTSLSVGLRMNFHFAVKDKLDPYIGFATGYSSNGHSIRTTSDNPHTRYFREYYRGDWPPLYLAATLGLRYYFNRNVGLYLEAGIDKWSIVQGGVAVKF